jgi:hypothetical protein
MSKGFQITFTANNGGYGLGIENEQYTAYIGIKPQSSHYECQEAPIKKIKPYRRPRKIKN